MLNLWWLFPVTFLSFMYLEIAFMRNCHVIFPRTEVRLCDIGFLQSSGSYSTYQVPSKDEWHWSGLVNLGCMYCYAYMCSLSITWTSSDVGSISFPQSLASGVWETWEEILPVKTKAKAAMSTSCFSVPFVTSSPSYSAVSSLCLWSSFCWCCTYEALVAFHIPHQFQLRLSVDLPDSIPACLGSGSTCFLGGLSLLPPACFLFAIEFKSIL